MASDIVIFDDKGNSIGKFIEFDSEILLDNKLILDLCVWRNLNLKFFLHQKPSTVQSTINFVKSVIESDVHSMFLMTDSSGESVGHFGYKRVSESCVELDNLVRSSKKLVPNFIEFAEATLIKEIFKLGYKEIRLRVFSSNVLARRIHEELGFQQLKNVKLKRVVKEEGDVLFEELTGDQDADAYLVYYSILSKK